jgi:hypothetical protein
MSKSSRIACSLAPAYFHHWRSKARISWSRTDSCEAAPASAGRKASAASLVPMSLLASRMPGDRVLSVISAGGPPASSYG